MALFQIGNETITIQVDSFGAELKSLKKVKTGTEYMWEGNPQFWKRTSPVLFPIVGSLYQGRYLHNGKEYPMGQHGFARDMEFQLKSQTNREIWFVLQSNEETRQKYPYDFQLEIGYELEENSVWVKWRVKNPAHETMYFSIGGHPAFCCPIDNETRQSDYRLWFDTKQEVVSGLLEGGLMSDKQVSYALEDGYLQITEHLFDKDALVIEQNQAQQVALVKPDGEHYLTVRFDAPLFGIWSPPGKNAPFICIEPWYGRCDRVNYEGTWEQREWGQKLDAGASFDVSYQILV